MDHQLVSQAAAGDKNALGQLLETFGPKVEAALSIGRVWRGLLDAADVMQVTYLEAFLRIRQFDAARADAFPAWLRRIAQNNLQDAIRGLETRRNPSPRRKIDGTANAELALLDILTAGVGTPSRAARENEAGAILRNALNCLPADYARAVSLYDLEGRAIAEVAAALNRSEGAIYMLRMRGIERLRELLGNPSRLLESQT